jgi:hypothetical protein
MNRSAVVIALKPLVLTTSSATVAGLPEMVARRNFLRPVGGYCETSGESFGVEELASGAKKKEAAWRAFRFAY